MRSVSRPPILVSLALLVMTSACGDDEKVTGPAERSGQYRGILAGGSPNQSASFDLMVAGTAKGTISLVGGGPVTVEGTYSAGTHAITVSGGGFTLTGTIDDTGTLLGTYTHQANSGYVAGFRHTAADPVTVFCGTYAGDAEGVWNLARRGALLRGAYVNVDGSDGYLSGGITGDSISITDIQDSPGGTAVGTLSGTTMTGTWSIGDLGGTWTADTGC